MTMKQEEDYSVTWNEVIGIVDKLIKRDEPMSMGEIERAVKKAWRIIFDNRCEQMELDEAIKYLDWYFECDDGGADKDACKAWEFVKTNRCKT